MSKPFYITTSIPYVNGNPHIGHAVEAVQVDAMARAMEMRGFDVRSQTGSDENSLKNVQAAEKAGEDTESFVARHAAEFDRLTGALGCRFDNFIRTREDRHMKGAQKLWSLCRPEDIYKKSYKGLYCVGCEAFYTEKDVPDGVCPTHKNPLDVVEEENYFFKLSNYQDQIVTLLEGGEVEGRDGRKYSYNIYPENRRNEMISFAKQGLEDFSISRSQERAKHWGVNVPGDDSQVMYVWFDALSNYITALDFAEDGDLYQKYWAAEDAKRMHNVGKDIVRFHAIYWPAMLLSAELPLPTDMYIHGFFTIEGEKMSKSLGNVIDPFELVEEFGPDALRYILLRELPYSEDGDLSRERMEVRYAELANQLGNLTSRVAAMSVKYFDGELDDVVYEGADALHQACEARVQKSDFKGYIDDVMTAVGDANEFVDEKEPFRLVKEDDTAAKQVLSELKARILLIAELMQPVIPEASAKIIEAYTGMVSKMDPLFPRRDSK